MALAYDVAEETADDENPERQEHDRVLAQLVRYFEEAEESSQTAREKAERDRDYYDNKQWTVEEAETLKKRGQPVITMNVIRARINYHLGMEKKQRRDPKCYGRGPNDQAAADIATEALRYAMSRTEYANERSRVWENIKIEGCGALEGSLKPRADGNMDVVWRQIAWDRFFADPHSRLPDYSDARYLGQVRWVDQDELLADYPDAEAAAEASLSRAFGHLGGTYEDRPRWQMWADARRKRFRLVQIYYREGHRWMFAEFVRGGILSAGESPFVDDQGESLCGIVAESCYIDRENNRYGEVRDLIDPQDEVNKRRSKALHLINTRTIIAEMGAFPDGDKEKVRREASRPDGLVLIAPGRRFEIDKNIELAAGQAQLLQQAQEHIAATGPNASLLGKGDSSQSGVAIAREQQGGLIELGDGLDVLRRLDHRVFRHTWCAIKQYWQAPMWIRITEDEEAPVYVGLNQMQMDPNTGRPSMLNPVAQMDVDIMIEDAPDVPSLDVETFGAMTEVMQASQGDPLLLKFLAETHPGLRSAQRKRLLALAEERAQQQQQAQAQAAKQAGQDQAIKMHQEQREQGKLETDTAFRAAELVLDATKPPPKPPEQGAPPAN